MKAAEKTFFLLDSMLEWAFSENYIKSFQPVPIEFKEILHKETDNLELFASMKQVRIISHVNSIEKILADKNMVKSILRNLLNNAIKYSHNLGEIIIDTKRAETFLEISVKDFGVGIDSDMINIISGTNQRFSTKGTNGEAGTGFGLLLCKEFVNIHKGKMWIISKPGEGSEVKFTLPLIIDN
jgi:signal transduction histidine kinase